VADLAVQLDNLLQLGDRPAELPLSTVNHRHVMAGHRFPGPVPHLPQDRQRLTVVLQRPLRLAQTAVRRRCCSARRPGRAALRRPGWCCRSCGKSVGMAAGCHC
jgi:hypothetical protein